MFVTVTVRGLELVPTITLPKSSLLELTLIAAWDADRACCALATPINNVSATAIAVAIATSNIICLTIFLSHSLYTEAKL